ncbi:MAG: DNA-directed RNA polymerase subunit delta [Bacilli bacterium]|nr:DNA-directed RNA polymerase subunit delta [Bacilli bacterium]
MKLNNIPKNELELLSYKEIAKMYLEENKITKTTADLFKEICKLLDLSDQEYVDKIADFFESLTTSKEFILLEDGTWDLKSNHKVKVSIEDLEDDTAEETESNSDDLEADEQETNDIDSIDDDNYLDDDTDDDLADLTIIDDDDLEE